MMLDRARGARAAIDIGSNTILLTVVDDTGRVLADEARVVGLGRGVGDRGQLAPDRMAAAEAVLESYVGICGGHGVRPYQVRAAATSAARRAMNAPTWLSRVRRKLGLKVAVLSGEDEAKLAWTGATADVDCAGPMLVVDLGGGSTELVYGMRTEIGWRSSLELGSVRLTERFLGYGDVDPAQFAAMRHFVEVEVGRVEIPEEPLVIGVAGTVTTLMALELGLTRWDPTVVHGNTLTRTALEPIIDRFLVMGPAARAAATSVCPERADFLLAGAVILDRILARAKAESCRVSDRGLRYGLLSA